MSSTWPGNVLLSGESVYFCFNNWHPGFTTVWSEAPFCHLINFFGTHSPNEHKWTSQVTHVIYKFMPNSLRHVRMTTFSVLLLCLNACKCGLWFADRMQKRPWVEVVISESSANHLCGHTAPRFLVFEHLQCSAQTSHLSDNQSTKISLTSFAYLSLQRKGRLWIHSRCCRTLLDLLTANQC